MTSVSYTLDTSEVTGHKLGVNSLAFSGDRLFSAGRDGMVASWSINKSVSNDAQGDDKYDEFDTNYKTHPQIDNYIAKNVDNETELSKLERSIARGLNFRQSSFNGFELDKYSMLHSDWINDISVLDDSTIASCSSDLSVKLWNHKTSQVDTLGHHSDYVKCLDFNEENNFLVSGGLDRQLKLWDVDHRKESSHYTGKSDRSSIYSVATSNHMICAGGPENAIQMYDHRIATPVLSLMGHRSTVRCLKISPSYILSGSSDTSVKLWCLRTNRILRTLDMHLAPVWSLHAPDPDFGVFYSGDKSGLLFKTDLRSCNYDDYLDESNNDNFILQNKINENLGVATLIADLSKSSKSENSVLSIVSNGSNVFTSTTTIQNSTEKSLKNTCIQAWKIPITNKIIIHQAIRLRKNILLLNSFRPGNLEDGDESRDVYDLVSMLSHETSNYDLAQIDDALSISHISPEATPIEDVIGLKSTPFASFQGGSSGEFAYADINTGQLTINIDPIDPDQFELLPMNDKPSFSCSGNPGLIRYQLLNNRRQVATMDDSLNTQLWDLLNFKKVDECMLYDTKDVELEGSDEESYRFESYAEKFQTNETLPIWCKVQVRAGKLFITLEENTLTNTEIYMDDLFELYPELGKYYSTHHNSESHDYTALRFNIGKLVLTSLFQNFVDLEIVKQKTGSVSTSSSGISKKTEDPSDSTSKKFRLFGRTKSSNNTGASSIISTEDLVESIFDPNQPFKFNNFEVPRISSTKNVQLIVNQQFQDLRNVTIEVYETNLSILKTLDQGSIDQVLKDLETHLPKWIINALFYNKYMEKPLNKVNFVLLDGTPKDSPHKLPPLENNSLKLSAYNMLRMRKVLCYIVEKFSEKPPEASIYPDPSSWLTVHCQGQKLDLNMTLATVKARIWKNSGDIELNYTRTVPPSGGD
ncbi:Ubiquitin-binding protein of unknown function [Komagataella phaffii CBS 7435]|uniref:Uncharacterized protein n=2 Tax=Komagataella phaffii TaxID=460519 RepID=C4R3P9_KOMPG|nr:uncharacterized protein PAS_chr3_0158 [Komagataella phaffii GS115]AOA63418.1 GQ67_03177T0 [Komagataella phaffii]CAH2450123.1 Ubiquitin-binding protein of unknown function [Komagataella phaffii CBS 7435]AOA68639.1 GQ68_03162T0 [Komagataella phaffii GS115]CAY70114.1 Putative protein of unknown function [Komagataella phaffii GS115]CCA40021.1 Ubiquitin-binding protein of unknown function [Komagataella phaffii CBS 7435]